MTSSFEKTLLNYINENEIELLSERFIDGKSLRVLAKEHNLSGRPAVKIEIERILNKINTTEFKKQLEIL